RSWHPSCSVWRVGTTPLEGSLSNPGAGPRCRPPPPLPPERLRGSNPGRSRSWGARPENPRRCTRGGRRPRTRRAGGGGVWGGGLWGGGGVVAPPSAHLGLLVSWNGWRLVVPGVISTVIRARSWSLYSGGTTLTRSPAASNWPKSSSLGTLPFLSTNFLISTT